MERRESKMVPGLHAERMPQFRGQSEIQPCFIHCSFFCFHFYFGFFVFGHLWCSHFELLFYTFVYLLSFPIHLKCINLSINHSEGNSNSVTQRQPPADEAKPSRVRNGRCFPYDWLIPHSQLNLSHSTYVIPNTALPPASHNSRGVAHTSR